MLIVADAVVDSPTCEGPTCEELPFDSRRIDYLPTQQEITEACAIIRKSWTLSERRRRFVGDEPPEEPFLRWRPPVIDTSYLRAVRCADIAM